MGEGQFFWGRDKHQIEQVNDTWKGKEGETTLLYFAVTAQSNTYELKLNQKTLEWSLEKVYQEG